MTITHYNWLRPRAAEGDLRQVLNHFFADDTGNSWRPRVDVREDLPRTPNGKFDRRLIRSEVSP